MRTILVAITYITFCIVSHRAAALPPDSPVPLPPHPTHVYFDRSPDDLESLKGKGERKFARNAEGEYLSNITYTEHWFGNKIPAATAEYLILSPKNPVVHQITLNYVKPGIRSSLIEEVSKYLGEPVQGESDPSAPSVYFASWIRGGLSYDLQDYDDRIEIYISPARLTDSDSYKLPYDINVIERVILPREKEHEALLLGVKSQPKSPRYDQVYLLIREFGTYTGGSLTTLPEGFGGGPTMQRAHFTGPAANDLLIIAPTGGSAGNINALVYNADAEQPKVLFEASHNAKPLTTLTGKFADGYKAVIDTGDPTKPVELDLVWRADEYDKMGAYKDGKLLKPVELRNDAYNGFELADADNDGIHELIAYQYVWSHATGNDRVALVKTSITWKGEKPNEAIIEITVP